MPLELTSFISGHQDWEDLLAAAPYYIKTKRTENFVLLKYDQLNSDFALPLVRECRGIILDEDDGFRPVCVPFYKFGNYGEGYVPDIDWASASVQEKIDGSLIKLWHCRGEWRVSSNGEIDARNAVINSALLTGGELHNLYELFIEAWAGTGVSTQTLDADCTYMFELTSPHNRIVVKYDALSIRHIGTRNNLTLEELDADIGVAKPRTFPLRTLADCLESARVLGYDSEGYVVVDKHFNRMKIKSPLYVTLNHLVQGTTTRGNVAAVIAKGEQAEFLTYFPEYSGVFAEIQGAIARFTEEQDALCAEVLSANYATRKELAAFVVGTPCPACLFTLIDGKSPSARDWLLALPSRKILNYIGVPE